MSQFEISPTYPLDTEASSLILLDLVKSRLGELLPWIEGEKLDQKIFSTLPAIVLEPRTSPCFPCALSVLSLYPIQFLHGVGTYVRDTFSRWLIPGQQIPIVGIAGLNFYFKQHPEVRLLFMQHLIGLENEEQKSEVLKNMPSILKELKITIMAVYQANRIVSMKGYSKAFKKLLVEESLSHLFQRRDLNFYEQVQNLLEKRSSDEKVREVKQTLNRLLQTRPKAFDRNVFHEMGPIVTLFGEKFSSAKNLTQMSRVIAHYYLLKRVIASKIDRSPQERHVSLKIYRTSLGCVKDRSSSDLKELRPQDYFAGSNHAIGILIMMNFMSDSEKFEQRNLLDAIGSCLPRVACSMQLFISDRKEGKIGFVYAEFMQADGQKFNSQEIRKLKQDLSYEIKRHVKKVIHPIFMPRNEEELLRNLVLLSKEIRYVKDLPQVSIHYEKQTENHLVFIVLLVRMKTPGTPCLHQVFSQGSLRVEIDDIRLLGQSKRKYPKESAILHIAIEKSLFFRPDFSLDLLRARHKVASELQSALGEFRDFNGGMIIKQEEVLSELRSALPPLTEQNEFLLENYFYSIRPVVAQTIHDPLILKHHFEILLRNLDIEFSLSSRYLFHETYGKYELFFLLSKSLLPQLDIRKEIGELKKDAHAWTSCFIQFDHMSAFGFIFRSEKPESAAKMKQLVQTLSDKSCCWG